MTRFFTIAVMLIFLNGCSMWQTSAPPMAVSPGGTAFSAGYSGSSHGGSGDSSSKNKANVAATILGLGILAGLVGGCFAIKSSKDESMCLSILDGLLSY